MSYEIKVFTGKTCVVHGPVYTAKPFLFICIGRVLHRVLYGVYMGTCVIVFTYFVSVCTVKMAID